MNASENLGKKRKKAIVEFGLVLMRMGIVLVLIPPFYSYTIIRQHHSKIRKAIIEMGATLMSSSLVLILITLFYYYAILIPAYHDPLWGPLEAFIAIAVPALIEALMFLSGILLLLVGLLIGLIGRRKKRESL